MKHFYITTPIYYVNDVPHLGHAYTTIAADALARYHRMTGEQVLMLTGTDEHGQKVQEAAAKRGLTPQQMCDQVAPRFEELWTALGIGAHQFIRTTEPRHKQVVTALWRRIRGRNPDDLYLATYEGWYCVGCEAFYTESQLTKDEASDAWHCPTHGTPVSWVAKERSWFFRLSAYADALLAHLDAHPDFIQPERYRNEVVSFIKSGLRDLSVSRTSFDWGIEVPEPDPEGHRHVIYVWMDALTNYVSALGGFEAADGAEPPDFAAYWRSAIHLIGKDILRFHAVYWPCFLMAAGLPLPQRILCHGWWTIGGRKISKSIPATRVDPRVLADSLGEGSAEPATGTDAVKYFLLRETHLGNDGDLIFENLIERYNADLANDLGNLCNRSLTMVARFAGKTAPTRDGALAATGAHADLARVADAAARDARDAWEAAAPSRALEATWRLVAEANRFIDTTQPWALAKQDRTAELGQVLHDLCAALWWLQRMIAPVLPATSRAMAGWLGVAADATASGWPEPGRFGADLPALTTATPTPLFPRIDDDRREALLGRWLGAAGAPGATTAATADQAAKAASAAADQPAAAASTKAARPKPVPVDAAPGDGAPPIAYEDFARCELRVGLVKTAVRVPKADKLLHLMVDLGEAADRSIVAGIATRYAPEELVGRRVLVVANLAPRKLRGIVSQGMILAAGDDDILGLAAVDAEVPPGTRVR